MRVLGIDAGTIVLGYGIVDSRERVCMVCCGILKFSPRIPIETRLGSLYTRLSKIIVEHQPDEVAIEEPFVGSNSRSALAIGRAQAAAILASVNHGLSVYRYAPAQIKQAVTNYGRSDKEQVQEMVRLYLGLSDSPQPSDAADALATAICHLQQSRLSKWLTDKT